MRQFKVFFLWTQLHECRLCRFESFSCIFSADICFCSFLYRKPVKPAWQVSSSTVCIVTVTLPQNAEEVVILQKWMEYSNSNDEFSLWCVQVLTGWSAPVQPLRSKHDVMEIRISLVFIHWGQELVFTKRWVSELCAVWKWDQHPLHGSVVLEIVVGWRFLPWLHSWKSESASVESQWGRTKAAPEDHHPSWQEIEGRSPKRTQHRKHLCRNAAPSSWRHTPNPSVVPAVQTEGIWPLTKWPHKILQGKLLWTFLAWH